MYGIPKEYEKEAVVSWIYLFKLNSSKQTSLKQPEKFRMTPTTRTIDGLLEMVHSDYAGIDFSPEYQREYVWSNEDKVKLIDSIFNNVTIGLFVFANRPYENDEKRYEIIDGKQRLTALIDFFEDRFQYAGFYYSELSRSDKQHFCNYTVSVATLEKPSMKEKYAAFLAVNTFGKVMNAEHLVTVKETYESL